MAVSEWSRLLFICCLTFASRQCVAEDVRNAPLQFVRFSASPDMTLAERLLTFRRGSSVASNLDGSMIQSLRDPAGTCPAESDCTFLSNCPASRRHKASTRCQVDLNQGSTSMRLPGGICCRRPSGMPVLSTAIASAAFPDFQYRPSDPTEPTEGFTLKSGHSTNFVIQSASVPGYETGGKSPLILRAPTKDSMTFVSGQAPVNEFAKLIVPPSPPKSTLISPAVVSSNVLPTSPASRPTEFSSGPAAMNVQSSPPNPPATFVLNNNASPQSIATNPFTPAVANNVPPPSNWPPSVASNNGPPPLQQQSFPQISRPIESSPQPTPTINYQQQPQLPPPFNPQNFGQVQDGAQQNLSFSAMPGQPFNVPQQQQQPPQPYPPPQVFVQQSNQQQQNGFQLQQQVSPQNSPMFPQGNYPAIPQEFPGQFAQGYFLDSSGRPYLPSQPAGGSQQFMLVPQQPAPVLPNTMRQSPAPQQPVQQPTQTPAPPPPPASKSSSAQPQSGSGTFCGVPDPLLGLGRSGRILGGRPSRFGAWPWMVAIESSKRLRCGATILNEQFLITAAHCVYKNFQYGYYQDLSIKIGLYDLEDEDSVGFMQMQNVRIQRVFVHPYFNASESSYDVALIQVVGSIKFRPNIKPVCLPTSEHLGEKGTVLGWGKRKETDDRSNLPTVLQEVNLPILYPWQCMLQLRGNRIYDEVGPQFICAGGKANQDACRGDSGGPLLASTNGRYWEIIGIVSKGYGCGKESVPGIYTNLFFLRGWIEETVARNWNSFDFPDLYSFGGRGSSVYY